MADPVSVGKVALKVASVVADEEKRKKITITLIVTVLAVFLLIILVPIYLITAPLSAVKDIITGDLSLSFIWDMRKEVWPDEDPSSDIPTQTTPIYNGGTIAMPINVSARITSLYGRRIDPITGKVGAFHSGIDFGVPMGTPLIAVEDGTVTKAVEMTTSYGYHIIIAHEGFSSLYAHGSKLLVKEGDTVTKGQVVMLSGNSGRSTGPHLHFEIRINGKTVNPYPYLFSVGG